MSPAKAGEPLRRVTLYLYEADCCAMQHWHSEGWTTRIREIIHERVQDTQRIGTNRRLTIGDIGE